MKEKKLKTQPLVLKVANDYIKANPYTIEKKGVKKMGRPTVMTQEVVRKLEHAFAHDCTVEEACIYAGISRETYYAFCRKHPDFSDRIKLLRHTAIMVARRTVIEAIPHNPTLAMKYLERKRPQEFSLRAKITHQSFDTNKHEVDPEQAEAVKQLFALFEKKAKETEHRFVQA